MIIHFTDKVARRISRIEAILRAAGTHEPTCASVQEWTWRDRPPCDCWLSVSPEEDPAA